MTDRKPLIIGTVLAVAVLVAGGVYLGRGPAGDPFAPCRTTEVAGGMDSFGTDFTLTSETGDRVTAAQVFTRPTLLYFGYTYCPDVCPLDSARNAEALALLREMGSEAQAVFITVDPRRDTPDVLREYTAQFDEDMIGLTGSEAEIAAVNKGWRNYYKAHDENDKEYYLVDHMTNTYLILPEAGTVEFFNRDVAPDQMAERAACFIDAAA